MLLKFLKLQLTLLDFANKTSVVLFFLIFKLFPIVLIGQNNIPTKSLLREKIIGPYVNFFYQVENGNINVDDYNIKNIFNDPTYIENDFDMSGETSNLPKCKSWEIYREKILYINRSKNLKIISVDCGDENLKYAKDGNKYYIWLKKTITIDRKNEIELEKNYIIRFTISIVYSSNEFKIDKVEIVKQIPYDFDYDEIADDYDADKYSKTKNVNIVGKEIIISTKPTINSTPIPNYRIFDKKRKKDPPYSRWDLKVTPSGYLPFGSSFNEKEFTSNNTDINSSGFAKIGYGGSLAIDLNITKNFGLTTGYQFYRFGINGENLKNRIISFLRNNNQAVNNIQLQNQGYLFHSTYFGAFVGKIDDLEFSFKIQPSCSYIIPIKNNPIRVNINYANTSQEIIKLELTPNPFFAFGGAVYLLFPAIEEKAIRFHVSATYLNGTIPFNKNKITFQSLATKLQFNDMKLNLFSVGAGVHISLKTTNKY